MSIGADPLRSALGVLSRLGRRVVEDGPLGALTTYRVGGAAAVRVTVASTADLQVVAEAVEVSGLPVLVVGKGSNLLVSDSGFPGLAVVLDPESLASSHIDGTTVTAGASLALPTLARRTVEAGLTGFEWAVGVPGSVGGAVRMNAGGHGSDTSSSIRRARVFSLIGDRAGEAWWDSAELRFGYRRSAIVDSDVVVSAEFGLAPGDADKGRETIRDIVRWRREHQPGGQNAGSVFTNPPGDSAGRLIDAAGLKGFRVGSASVSEKHANFFQAEAGGSADDVFELIHAVRRRVAAQTGVDLHPEVRLIGFGSRPQQEVEG